MRQQFFPNEIRSYFYPIRKNCSKPCPVVFLIRINRRLVKLNLGLKVYPSQWNTYEQRATISQLYSKRDNANNIILNNVIEKVLQRFLEFKSYLCNYCDEDAGIEATFKSYFADMKKKDQRIDIVKAIKNAIINDTTLTEGTSKNYLNKGLPALSKYLFYLESENGIRVDNFKTFTTEFFNSFASYLHDCYKQPNGKPFAISTLNSILKYAKSAVVLTARKHSYLSDVEISAIKLKELSDKSADNHIALRDDEIVALYNYSTTSKDDEIIRDLFLLECTLGHRISDILILDKRLESIGNDYYITIAPKKTPNKKIEVNILFDIAKRILIDKYKCQLPSCTKDKINRNIKRIAKEAGVCGEELQSIHYQDSSKPTETKVPRYECISTHTARRTFVTMLSARGLSYEQISQYTGQTIKVVEHYDKCTPKYRSILESNKRNDPKQVLLMCDEAIGDSKLAHHIEATVSSNLSFHEQAESFRTLIFDIFDKNLEPFVENGELDLAYFVIQLLSIKDAIIDSHGQHFYNTIAKTLKDLERDNIRLTEFLSDIFYEKVVITNGLKGRQYMRQL